MAALPVEGAANGALVTSLRKQLAVSGSDISDEASRMKVIQLHGDGQQTAAHRRWAVKQPQPMARTDARLRASASGDGTAGGFGSLSQVHARLFRDLPATHVAKLPKSTSSCESRASSAAPGGRLN
jgi:hypothetical protein